MENTYGKQCLINIADNVLQRIGKLEGSPPGKSKFQRRFDVEQKPLKYRRDSTSNSTFRRRLDVESTSEKR